MLETLHRIVKEVNAAPNLEQALSMIVSMVKRSIACDVCSVYLTDADARAHVLAATDGLRQESVGKVALPMGRGLVGLVAELRLRVETEISYPLWHGLRDTLPIRYHRFEGSDRCVDCLVMGLWRRAR